jgi:hypothetical protein
MRPFFILSSVYCALRALLLKVIISLLSPSLCLLRHLYLSYARHRSLLEPNCEGHAPRCGEPQRTQHTAHHTGPYTVSVAGTHESPVNAIPTAGISYSSAAFLLSTSSYGVQCVALIEVTLVNHSMSLSSQYAYLYRITSSNYFTPLFAFFGPS